MILAISAAAISVVALTVGSISCYRFRKEKARKIELSEEETERFFRGQPESLNPTMGLGQQAHLLPFEKNWDFPSEKLKLGEVLGSGQFGYVLKAVAGGICPPEPETTVAVKRRKPHSTLENYQTHLMEVKIMSHLGMHLNIVNFLGACTKGLAHAAPRGDERYHGTEIPVVVDILTVFAGLLHAGAAELHNTNHPSLLELARNIANRLLLCLAKKSPVGLSNLGCYPEPVVRVDDGEVLGSGQFGYVLKAVAGGICPPEPETTVAVKRRKPHSTLENYQTHLMEVKIMSHLGMHLNIVNFLGACTKGLAHGDLMMIMEYCPLGSLEKYLRANEPYFVDLMDRHTKTLDDSTGRQGHCTDDSANEDTALKAQRNGTQGEWVVKYVAAASPATGSGGTDAILQKDSVASDSGILPSSSGSENDSKHPALKGNNYHQSLEGCVRSRQFTTGNLVSWAYQIAKGMEFLGSRKVVYRNLATRSILLTGEKIAKISDFDLARDIYENIQYITKGDGPLPMKWMALESLTQDKVYTSKSDVWAYGITLWEMFSLGKTPYPGINGAELVRLLQTGYRMEAPRFADHHFYEIMRKCWDEDPSNRPTFHALSACFGEMLPESERLVVYRNLATRSILLTGEKIAKISDFDLARDIYKNIQYITKGDSEPFWGIGPYLPRLEQAEEVCPMAYLRGAKRLHQFYEIMRKCWDEDPSNRPTFHALSACFGEMLPESERLHYMEKYELFEKKNAEYFRTKTDYLKLIATETEDGYQIPLSEKYGKEDISTAPEHVKSENFPPKVDNLPKMETITQEDHLQERQEPQMQEENSRENSNLKNDPISGNEENCRIGTEQTGNPGPLPMKWMALESLTQDKVYTSKSDVWAYGITLWEMFSLGKTPYPGINGAELVRLLQTGYRMEAPRFADHHFYEIMRKCWDEDPSNRPTFHALSACFGEMLPESERLHYMEKYELFDKKNAEYFRTKTDYLKLIATETEDGYQIPLSEKYGKEDISTAPEHVKSDNFPPKVDNLPKMETITQEDHLQERQEPQMQEENSRENSNLKNDPISGNEENCRIGTEQTGNPVVEDDRSVEYEKEVEQCGNATTSHI
ncbi:unnamed protein product [Darwinula stevensoni]|uniref:Protein kinase domain-containing protein n=1 Tax=Darwinula stevensoni TaxID=69355 RepID=A0A7R8XFI8_9CRUS|nr:unnamed protein product [Darwinula stevensoni]CAG0888866.1 unnamed protein product [Darwinula stevensoni]